MLVGLVVEAVEREQARREQRAQMRARLMSTQDADKRLEKWAAWSVRDVSGGLGYPSHAAFLQVVAPSTRPLSGDEFLFSDPEEQETDRVVADLPELRRRVVRVHYLGDKSLTVAEKARRVRVPTKRWGEVFLETLQLVAYRLSGG